MNCVAGCLIAITGLYLSQDPAGPASRKPDLSDILFGKGLIPELKIQVAEPELEKLRANNRKYVRCTIVENGKTTFKNVAVKLKGAAGSFRDFDDRPALTLNASKFNKGQLFHGLNKFHLNNSVQDPSYANEWLCEELFRAAGVPATRVTHARVWLNDRDVGLYVLKEGFDSTFLQRHFQDPDGNLYDGGFVQDIDAELEKDSGEGVDDRSDLIELVNACREPDEAERWRRVGELVDIDAFIKFMAMELMTCHWDGYTQNRNNYRIYFNPIDKKAHFLPHGMDQMFGDPGAPILEPPGAIVSSTVMQNPEWRAQYRDKVKELLTLFDPPKRLQGRLDVLQKRLRPVLTAMGQEIATDHAEQIKSLQQRVAERAESLRDQSDRPEPGPVEFDEGGRLQISDWQPASESEDAVIEEVELADGERAYSIRCGASGHCVASWRRRILLPMGRFTFQGQIKTQHVAEIEDEKGSAAGLRISGATRTNTVHGSSSDWQPIEFEFTIDQEQAEVVLVAELRTSQGVAWFDPKSFWLVRKPLEQPE